MILTFGEIMLRINPEGFLRFRQALPGRMEVTFGGGEANVAASLSLFGNEVRFLTALPKNPIADALCGHLRNVGVDTKHIAWREDGRVGIYYLETGANQRSSTVVYDRSGSAAALAGPADYDFPAALRDVTWLHVTGITPAISENAFLATLQLVELAKAQGAQVSCDLNFRKKLWRWRSGTAPKALAEHCMSQILPHVDVLIANEEDASDVLDIHAEGTDVMDGRINAAAYELVARQIVERFPSIRYVAITLRESVSATHNNWGGMLYDVEQQRAFFSPLDAHGHYEPYEIRSIVDRVGGGDSFAAGVIHVLSAPANPHPDPQTAIRFAVAASALKHSVHGDFNYVTLSEVEALVKGMASGRVQR